MYLNFILKEKITCGLQKKTFINCNWYRATTTKTEQNMPSRQHSGLKGNLALYNSRPQIKSHLNPNQ